MVGEQKQFYRAFISYSHRDKSWGEWLHKAIETYRTPRKIAGNEGRDGTVPKRLFPIFRDTDELPTSADLGQAINSALAASRYLIVICSPDAANSRWVNEEILTFKQLGKENQILAIIVGGDPNAADRGDVANECFPPALRYRVGADGELTDERTEPIAADARDEADGKANANLKILAGLLGVLIAVPLTAAIRILVGHVWRTRVLGQSWKEATDAMIEVTEPPERLARISRKAPGDQSRLFDTQELSGLNPTESDEPEEPEEPEEKA